MLERVSTVVVGMLCMVLALGLVALGKDLRERARQIYLKYFARDYRPSLFAFYLMAFVLLALGA